MESIRCPGENRFRFCGPLVSTLSDKDPDIKMRAAKSLGEIGDERALEPLKVLLKDKNPMSEMRPERQ